MKYFLIALCMLVATPACAKNWWVIYADGVSPERRIVFADGDSVKLHTSSSVGMDKNVKSKVYEIDVIQVLESVDAPGQIKTTYLIDCEKNLISTETGWAIWRDGRRDERQATAWASTRADYTFERIRLFGCDEGARNNANQMLSVSSTGMSPVELTRNIFWVDGMRSNQSASAETKKAANAAYRTSPKVGLKPEVNKIYPAVSFDKAAAAKALGRGTSSIKGIACVHHDQLVFYAQNRKIYLFPATPYLKEWIRLKDEADAGKDIVYISDEVFATRVEAETDSEGRFQFTEMKPGKYYLYMQLNFNQRRSGKVYTGTSYGNYGVTVDHYQKQDYFVARGDELGEFVEVDREGQVVKVHLSEGGGLVGLISQCSGI